MLGGRSEIYSVMWRKLGIIWKIGDIPCDIPPTSRKKDSLILMNVKEMWWYMQGDRVSHTFVSAWVKVYCFEKVMEYFLIHKMTHTFLIWFPTNIYSHVSNCAAASVSCACHSFGSSSLSVYDSTYFPLCMPHASYSFDGYFYYCVRQLFPLITWVQQLYAVPPFYLSLPHIVLFLHVLLPLCVVSVWPCIVFFSSFLFLSCSFLQCLSFACLYFAPSISFLLLSLQYFLLFPQSLYLSCFFWLWPPALSHLCQPAVLLSFSPQSLTLSCTLFFPPLAFSLSLVVCLASCVSESMVVCAVHPPASHSAPSFLRQYAGHLGRTALRREPGGGLERDRAFLSLHRTGSLGTHAHTHLHSNACMHL